MTGADLWADVDPPGEAAARIPIGGPVVGRAGMSIGRADVVASPLVRTAHVALPLLAGNIAHLVQTSIDSAFVARVSTSTLAALAVAAPLYSVSVMAVRGWATATRTLAAQWHGCDEPQQVRGVLTVAAPVGMGIGLVVGGALPRG